MNVHLGKIGSDEHLSEAFSYFDKNQSGYVEFDELRDALLDDHLVKSNDQVIHDILFEVDLDKVNKTDTNIVKILFWSLNYRVDSALVPKLVSFQFGPQTFPFIPLSVILSDFCCYL